MPRVLIVYHSQSGASARLAGAARDGAETTEGVKVTLRRVWDAGAQDILAVDGLLLVAAENSGSLSGGMKDFLDRTFYPVGERGCVSGFPMREAVEPVICRGPVTSELEARARELGAGFAAGLEMGIF